MLCEASIRTEASICASGESGMCTAIWSPSKSALKAVQTSGWILMALPSTSTGSNAWIPRRWRSVRGSADGVVLDDLFEDVQTMAPAARPSLRLLDGGAMAGLLQPVIDEGLEELERHLLGQAALVQLQLGATTITERPE